MNWMDLSPTQIALILAMAFLSILAIIIFAFLFYIKTSFLDQIPVIKKIVATLKNPTIPSWLKGVGVVTSVLYFVMPLDFLPDVLGWLFGLGFVDDILVISLIFTGIENFWKNLNKGQKIEAK